MSAHPGGSPLPNSWAPPCAHPSVQSTWCNTAQCPALPLRRRARAGLCPGAWGHGFPSSMSLSKATHATVLPQGPLPAVQGARGCPASPNAALNKQGNRTLPSTRCQTSACPKHSWGPPQPGWSGQCPGWAAMPCLPTASSRHMHMQGRNNPTASVPTAAHIQLPGGTRAHPQPSAWPSQAACGAAGPLVPWDMFFSCTHHREARTAHTSKAFALTTEPHATTTAHSVHAIPLCRAHPPIELNPCSAGMACLEPPCSFQPPHLLAL